jgi:tetratricopeptide (TPR) repeat protein
MNRVRCCRLAILATALPLAIEWSVACAEEPAPFTPQARERFEKAQELAAKGQFLEAIKAFDEAKKLGMESYPRAHLYQANTYLSIKDYDGAIARYTKFIADFSMEESCRY